MEGRGVQNYASETFTPAARCHSNSYPYVVESHHTDAADDPPQLSTYPTPCPPGATLRTTSTQTPHPTPSILWVPIAHEFLFYHVHIGNEHPLSVAAIAAITISKRRNRL